MNKNSKCRLFLLSFFFFVAISQAVATNGPVMIIGSHEFSDGSLAFKRNAMSPKISFVGKDIVFRLPDNSSIFKRIKRDKDKRKKIHEILLKDNDPTKDAPIFKIEDDEHQKHMEESRKALQKLRGEYVDSDRYKQYEVSSNDENIFNCSEIKNNVEDEVLFSEGVDDDIYGRLFPSVPGKGKVVEVPGGVVKLVVAETVVSSQGELEQAVSNNSGGRVNLTIRGSDESDSKRAEALGLTEEDVCRLIYLLPALLRQHNVIPYSPDGNKKSTK